MKDRMKRYESVNKHTLIPRMYSIIRSDGKAFHTFTKGFQRPFCSDLAAAMDSAAKHLLKHVQGAKCAYVQSDEISIVMTDFDNYESQPWVKGQIQKVTSLTASMATSGFNASLASKYPEKTMATFDSRVFQVPTKAEVLNYLIWRQKDAIRNSIAMVAQTHYSQKQLNRQPSVTQLSMIRDAGDNWDNYSEGHKYGRLITKHEYTTDDGALRKKWEVVDNIPEFIDAMDTDFFDFIPDLATV